MLETPSCAHRAGCAVKIRDENRRVILLFERFMRGRVI